MRSVEFVTTVGSDGTVVLPPELAAQVEQNQTVRVIVIIEDAEDREDWSKLTAEQFFNGYDDADAIYDDISER